VQTAGHLEEIVGVVRGSRSGIQNDRRSRARSEVAYGGRRSNERVPPEGGRGELADELASAIALAYVRELVKDYAERRDIE
jgi:hypothetical protein